MKQLVILSGKGGTGKTSVAAALAHLAASELSITLADADVDAANLELVLDPEKLEEQDFMGGQLAIIEPDECTACGICADVCRFDAVIPGEDAYQIDASACEGCASCFYQCPTEAIRMEEQRAGLWFRSETRFGPLFHAHLFAGQENSGKLVTMVKQQGRLLTMDDDRDLLIVDGPPGIGCPVIASIAGADMALLVVEPTVAGVHDLERVLGTTRHFGVPALVCLNKADVNGGANPLRHGGHRSDGAGPAGYGLHRRRGDRGPAKGVGECQGASLWRMKWQAGRCENGCCCGWPW